MEQLPLNNFLKKALEDDTWKYISERYVFSMEMLEKYSDKLNWDDITINCHNLWTVKGVEKLADKINWNIFSRNCPKEFVCEEILVKFSDKWDWSEMSSRKEFYNNWNLLEKFKDKADWNRIIKGWEIERPVEFLTKFKKYLPLDKIQETRLWSDLVLKYADMLIKEIVGIK